MVRIPGFHLQGPRFNLWVGNWDPTSHKAQLKKRKQKQNQKQHDSTTIKRKLRKLFSCYYVVVKISYKIPQSINPKNRLISLTKLKWAPPYIRGHHRKVNSSTWKSIMSAPPYIRGHHRKVNSSTWKSIMSAPPYIRGHHRKVNSSNQKSMVVNTLN